MGKAKRVKRSKIIDRHPWAVLGKSRKCDTCLRMFQVTEAMEKVCEKCQK